jgi:hypothetical protein
MGARLFGWWRFSEGLAARIAHPRRDLVAADAAAWEIIQSSGLLRIVRAWNVTVARAWPSSRVGRSWAAIKRIWLTCERADRLRAAGRCASTASLTVLLLQTIESGQGAPFRWILPLAFGVVGLVVELAAAPILRRAKRGRD